MNNRRPKFGSSPVGKAYWHLTSNPIAGDYGDDPEDFKWKEKEAWEREQESNSTLNMYRTSNDK